MANVKVKAKAQPEPTIQRPLKRNPDCTRCKLGETSQTVCCRSVGPKRPDIMLVGEALGANEEIHCRPFVGDAGRKLNYLLSKAKLRRKRLRIRNTVSCRPPGNAAPSKTIIEACYPYLWHDILVSKPKVIVALGSVAYRALGASVDVKGKLKMDTRGVTDWRGFYEQRTIMWDAPNGKHYEHTFWIVPTFHPSACLRNWEKDDLLVHDLKIAKDLSEGKQPLKYPDTKVTVIKTKEEAIRFLRHLRKVGAFVVDLETAGSPARPQEALDPHRAKIMCAGFCYRDGHATILPFYRQNLKPYWTPRERNEIIEEFTGLLEHAKLYGQNIKFDIKHLRKLTGLVDYKIGFDTMIAHHVVDENKPHNLTFLCQWYLRWWKYDSALDQFKFSKGKKTMFRVDLVPDQMLWNYCGYDVDGTWRLRRKLIPLINEEKVAKPFRVELDLTVPLADVEFRGLQGDRARLLQLSAVYRKQSAAIVKKLQTSAVKLLGVRKVKGKIEPFNPNSPKQLTELLKTAGADLRKTTKGGSLAVDKYVLAALALKKNKAGTIAKNVQELRRLGKYISTYLDGKDGDEGFLQYMGEGDRWHPTYNITNARTPRLSADDPAIQTVPRLMVLRSMVIPDNEECMLIAVDYEKIELCVMSWLANDEVMVQELLDRVDLHTKMGVTARLMRNPTDEEFKRIAPMISKDERAVAKGVNFGIPYGRGAYAIAEANPDAFPGTMPKNERTETVQKVINAFFEKYWGITEYRERVVQRLEDNGQLREYMFHRLRRLPAVDWYNSKWGMDTDRRDADFGHLKREALNFEIQALATQILNMKTKVVYDGIQKVRIPGLRINQSLHDALMFNCNRAYTDEAVHHITEWMETSLPKDRRHKFEMPLKVEALVQNYWGEEYSA